MMPAVEQQAPPELLRVIDRVYETCGETIESVLGFLCVQLGATVAALGWYDFETRRGGFTHVAGLDRPFALARASGSCATDSVFAVKDRIKEAGLVWRDRDVVDAEELEQSGFYQQWAFPQGLQHIARGVLTEQGSRLTYVALGRRADSGDFDSAELETMRRMLPHLQRTLELGQNISALHAVAGLMSEILNRLPVALLVISPDGKVTTRTRAADQILACNDQIYLDGTSLQLRRADARARLRELVAAAHSAPAPSQFYETMHVERIDRRPLYLTVSSISGGPGPDGRRFVLLIIVDPEHEPVIDGDALRARLGLTRSEAQLAALLARGVRLEAASESLSISSGTARTHLKHIFAKTGTDRQVELVRLILSNPVFSQLQVLR
jgi:DNA-binding CsgD family transcriptional regulator